MVVRLFGENMLRLIEACISTLPRDVFKKIEGAYRSETSNALAQLALSIMRANAIAAMIHRAPICEDTGIPTFYVRCPDELKRSQLSAQIKAAVEEATSLGLLRPNCIDSITGESSPNNIGIGVPIIHFDNGGEIDKVEVCLLLKGAGSENQNRQYSLPCELDGFGLAERNTRGILKCVLHALYMAQGFGCSPGFIGVCVGGDRASGYECAKRQLLRSLDDENGDEQLRQLEVDVMRLGNELGVGALGFGGAHTLLSCKFGKLHRHPASFFVSVAYMCWAYRRLGMVMDAKTGKLIRWLYEPTHTDEGLNFTLPSGVKELSTPLTEGDVRRLSVGDVVKLNGVIYTGRDMVHMRLSQSQAPNDLRGYAIYHCGPMAVKRNDRWVVLAAGPTTSIRHEPYQASVIERHGLRAVIGKGGMGARTKEALKRFGAVYLHAIGGAAKLYADCIEDVEDVWWLDEFGLVEAMWKLKVKNFVAVVTMDAHGNSLHDAVRESSALALERIMHSINHPCADCKV
ncbi:MAG: FumA C-terminus/TtdB family hydratase beta subunit [Armatimonadota bacterium]|nr:FumA C-terminus/TtdB family hydratase beta subunit [Armatimonadota bacterium]MCX7778398.1 FumA C-terminus/TtdB family hydratase beta subunit [Armatimonadota bacterium]MDW8026267.1 FumA C-terminus/TtdB family hydratase beta subunit [Armatimonadota bacterium]